MLENNELIEITLLNPNPYQARIDFDEMKMLELASNIERNGLRQNIDVIVSPIDNKYYLVAGERRMRAHILNSSSHIKATVRRPETAAEAINILIMDMYNENEQSVMPSATENAVSYRERLRQVHINKGKVELTSARYTTVEQLATQLLGYEMRRTITAEQRKSGMNEYSLTQEEKNILKNKIKHINKSILHSAKTTNYIEDQIEFHLGTEDRYLMTKIAELGQAYHIQKISAGKMRLKKKRQAPNPQAETIMNNFYDMFNVTDLKTTTTEYRESVNEEFIVAIKEAKTFKKSLSNEDVVTFKNHKSKIVRKKNEISLTIGTKALNETTQKKVNKIVKNLEKLLHEANSANQFP